MKSSRSYHGNFRNNYLGFEPLAKFTNTVELRRRYSYVNGQFFC